MTGKSKIPDNAVNSLFDGTGVPNLKQTAPPTERLEQTAPEQIHAEPQKIPRRSTRSRNSERLEIRLTPELKKALSTAAADEQTDTAEILRRAAREYLKAKGYF